ncbi:hypothetical protein [Chryseobacterium takakiae]|uniref:Uncharacterized protein n=1 Tax=Chryseobacterium takakiae TaxID=1302685 RepID=A0A1M5BGH5_9FLAO|nr:hypothetical protein [Chryseobacterium takakiae]SHF41693.1 hypothetical protein SAMN05444408_11921 [Chryseobacterium takakiae]
MGIGVSIILFIIAIGVLSFILGIIGSLITCFLVKKKRRRKILFAFIVPFLGLYTIYFCGIIGSVIVSEIKKVDAGIGDAWYVPLKNSRQLLFIDFPKEGYISNEETGQLLVSDIIEIEEKGDAIFGKISDNEYFYYNIQTDEIKKFDNESELIEINFGEKLRLTNAYEFYLTKYKDIAGNWFVMVGFISLTISLLVLYTTKKIMGI